MPNEPQPEDPALAEYVQQDPAETLIGELDSDPLDAGYVPPDRPYPAAETVREQLEGASLDERLREEEPEPAAFDDTDRPVPRPSGVDPDRAGRLVADDEGVRRDDVGTLTARDAGVDGGASSAEEAAVHLADENVEVAATDAPPPEAER